MSTEVLLPPAATEAAFAEALPPEPKARLLIVDDETSVQNALRRLLRKEGYTIFLASGGQEGLQVLEREPIDLIISDMRMPQMDGAQFLQAARERWPDAVRLLITGYADIQSTIAAINHGEIHRYITKPWDDNDLALIVREMLSRRDLERQNRELRELTERQNADLREMNRTLEDRVKARTIEIERVNDMLNVAYKEINETFLISVNVFSGLLEMRGNGIAGHARRAAELARHIGLRLKLSDRELQDLHLGALLHDIGKIAFPDHMLRKSVAQMSTEDVKRYRRHPVDGEASLMPVALLSGAARMVRQHHERMDGMGFPDGLLGPDIVLGARIIAVASDFDALVHGDLGEKCYTTEAALRAIQGGRNGRYDPEVVAVLPGALEDIAKAAAKDVLIDALDLQPGMVLAHELVSPRGTILLVAGYVFEARIIKQVRDFAQRENVKMPLRVRLDSIPPGARVFKGIAA